MKTEKLAIISLISVFSIFFMLGFLFSLFLTQNGFLVPDVPPEFSYFPDTCTVHDTGDTRFEVYCPPPVDNSLAQ